MTSAADTTLKPCPFCSGVAEVTINSEHWPVVQCDECGCQGPCIERDKCKAAERWNARADQERQCRLEHDLLAYGRMAKLWAAVGAVLFVWLMVQVISGVKW